MVKTIQVSKKDAERVRKIILEKGLYNKKYKITSDESYVYFPVTKSVRIKGAKEVNKRLHQRERKETTKEVLSTLLTKKQLEELPRSYEIIGDILILELPKELERKEKQIAQAFLSTHKQIKIVAKKSKIHSGTFRTRKVKIIAGEKRKETEYLESGCRFNIHIENVYFSSRLSNERLRIAKQVKKNEDVLVMFSGAAPYCCVIAKHSPVKSVTGIEINPDGHKYGLINIKKNKVEDKVNLYLGDVKKVLPKLKKNFDRIIMPLPKTAHEFLPAAFRYIKKNGIIHFYTFSKQEEVKTEGRKLIKEACAQARRKCRILRAVKVGQHAPYVWRVCYDIKVG